MFNDYEAVNEYIYECWNLGLDFSVSRCPKSP